MIFAGRRHIGLLPVFVMSRITPFRLYKRNKKLQKEHLLGNKFHLHLFTVILLCVRMSTEKI